MNGYDEQTYLRRYGPTAVVTGATDGIGRAMAFDLARRGFSLLLVARRSTVLDDVAALLRDAHRVDVSTVALDLSDPLSWRRLLDVTAEIDVGLLVAAAGFGTSGDFLDADTTVEVQMVNVNSAAVVALARGFGRRMTERGSGGLVLLSSIVAFQGVPRSATYAATKGFVQTFAEGIAPELRPRGIDVIAVAPGPVRSGFADRADMRMGRALTPNEVAKPALDALGRRSTVAPGALSRVMSAALAPLPRRGRVAVMTRVMGAMTAHLAHSSAGSPR